MIIAMLASWEHSAGLLDVESKTKPFSYEFLGETSFLEVRDVVEM